MDSMDDKELYQAAFDDEQPDPASPETPAQQPADETAEQARDETGRFDKSQVDPEPVTQPDPVATATEKEASVPSFRLREEREAREAAERRAQEVESRLQVFERQFQMLQQQQQPQQQPQSLDWYGDPEGSTRHVVDPIRSEISRLRGEMSEVLARQFAGNEKVDEVKKWVVSRVNDQALNARVAESPHPWGELIKAFDEQRIISEIGTDPNAYKDRLLEGALSDPAFLAKALEKARTAATQNSSKSAPLVQIPPSINRASSAASPHDQPGSMDDGDLYAFATR